MFSCENKSFHIAHLLRNLDGQSRTSVSPFLRKFVLNKTAVPLICHSNFDLSVSYVGSKIKLLGGRGGACSSRKGRENEVMSVERIV